MGAKPVCNTDVFCFAPPDTPPTNQLPPACCTPAPRDEGRGLGRTRLRQPDGHPHGQRGVYFDPRYLGNPLVYCGNVGIMIPGQIAQGAQPGDLVVAIGGRTGRDGIHGATFSSAELTSQSETVSGGAVQIGNAITEKMVLDVCWSPGPGAL